MVSQNGLKPPAYHCAGGFLYQLSKLEQMKNVLDFIQFSACVHSTAVINISQVKTISGCFHNDHQDRPEE